MNIIYWALCLILISFWVLGYYYIKFYGEVAAQEHRVSIARTKLKHQIAGLEKEKEKLDRNIESMVQEIDKYRQEINQNS